MPTVNMPTIPDEIEIDLTSQVRHMMPGRFTLPIGVSHELIRRGVAKPRPEFAAIYKVFDESCKRSEERQSAAQEEKQKAQEKQTQKTFRKDNERGYRHRNHLGKPDGDDE